jgi:DNA-binding protein
MDADIADNHDSNHEIEESSAALENYRFTKRAPQRQFGSKHDIFVSSGSSIVAAVKKVQKMLKNDPTSSVTIHGLSAAIKKAVDIANYVAQAHAGSLSISVRTSSIPLVDDYEPLIPDLPPISQIRLGSAIHVTLTPTALAPKKLK